MNRTLRYLIMVGCISLIVAGVIGVIAPTRVQTQTAINSTTTAAAMTRTATSVQLTSDTGVTATTFLYIDGELMQAQSEVGTTGRWNVRRALGDGASGAVAHVSGSYVWVLPTSGAGQSYATYNVSGGCAANDFAFQPFVNTKANKVFECEAGQWMERHYDDQTIPLAFSRRDSFQNGYAIMQDDGTVQSVTDAEENFVSGSPLGAIEFREELTKTVSSWVTSTGRLDLSADDTTTDEGVEIVFGSAGAATNSYAVAGTTGACISASIRIDDISGTDQVQIGFRDNAAFTDAAAYAGYTVWNTVGVNNVDGSIMSSQEVSEATDTDDTAVNWADGETRALKVCVSRAGVPTAFYSDAYTYTRGRPDFPVYRAITMTETGSTLTAATGLLPFLSYLAEGTDGPDVLVNWVQLTRLP